MAYEKRDMTFSLFKNETKTQDTHSDYQGWILVNGQEYWLNGWIKDGAKGKFVSGTLKPKTAERGRAVQSPPRQGGGRGADLSDDIPFSAEFR